MSLFAILSDVTEDDNTLNPMKIKDLARDCPHMIYKQAKNEAYCSFRFRSTSTAAKFEETVVEVLRHWGAIRNADGAPPTPAIRAMRDRLTASGYLTYGKGKGKGKK